MDRPSRWLGDPVRSSQRLLVATVIVTLVFSGPLVPGLTFTGAGTPSTVGEGNASVSAVHIDAESTAITPGRFGTGVRYLRAPDATVDVDAVTGTPRIVYVLDVPELDTRISATRLLSGSGRVTVRPSDRAFPPETVANERYKGNLTVRIQSFSTDWTVYHEPVTVEVNR